MAENRLTLAKKLEKRLEKEALKAIAEADIDSYVRMLREAGLKGGTPAYENALKVFYDSLKKR